MKVLKEGDKSRLNPAMYFKCPRCACEFIANRDECKCEKHEGQRESTYVSIEYACPTCGNPVYAEGLYDPERSDHVSHDWRWRL